MVVQRLAMAKMENMHEKRKHTDDAWCSQPSLSALLFPPASLQWSVASTLLPWGLEGVYDLRRVKYDPLTTRAMPNLDGAPSSAPR